MRTINLGDILVSHWGYDQINVDFYQVIARTAKMVTIRRIRVSRRCASYALASHVMPIKDAFLDDDSRYSEVYGKPSRHKIQHWGNGEPYVRIESYSTARLWDGTECTETETH